MNIYWTYTVVGVDSGECSSIDSLNTLNINTTLALGATLFGKLVREGRIGAALSTYVTAGSIKLSVVCADLVSYMSTRYVLRLSHLRRKS